ncbi:EAL domain-containing protein [Zavarzinia aquatilis]|uniref:Diguanylate cyclase n=1 Tax=Zavarzinia aquatilis TaxID=2211142 RepID=A0A317EHE6_9PROT|nr:EAL domain-containing protein [Zavarzinia aquatilis]PWR25500.1 diguanylate cyclase [Zavarzinia aquatilis]
MNGITANDTHAAAIDAARSKGATMRRGLLATATLVGTGALYLLLAFLGTTLAQIADPSFALGFANAAVLALLWRSAPHRALPALVGSGLACLLFDMAGGTSFFSAAGLSCAVTVHILLTLGLARKTRGYRNGIGGEFRALLVAAAGVPLLTGFIVAANRVGMASSPLPFLSVWWLWWLSSCVGVIALLPIALSYDAAAVRRFARSRCTLGLIGTMIACFAIVAFSDIAGHTAFALVSITLVLASLRLPRFATAVAAAACNPVILIAFDNRVEVPLQASHILAMLPSWLPALALLAAPYAIARLIEEHRGNQRVLEENERRFRGAMDNAAIGMAFVAPNGIIVESNRAFADMLGYKPAQLVGTNFRDITYPDDLTHDVSQLERILEGAIDSYRMEKRYVTIDGRVIWCNLAVSASRDAETRDVLHLIAQIENIDQRKKAEAALSESESRWSFALESSRHGVWDRDLVVGRTLYSPMWTAMLGLRQEDVGDNEEKWLELIHPDDRERALRLDEACIAGTTDNFAAEFRMRHRDGRWIWILDRGRVVSRDADGKATRMIGTHADITARKEAEQNLRDLSAALFEEKERLRVTLYSIGDAVICSDTAALVTFMNPVAEQLTGWTAAEALGRPAADIFRLQDTATDADLPNPIEACLRELKPYYVKSDAKMLNRAGRYLNVQDSAAPIRNADGELLGAVLVFQDVTRARELEHELEQSARHDVLTGLPNRLALEQSLVEACDEVVATRRRFALAFMDLDRFKILNDSAGHEAGNALLVEVARCISSLVGANDLTVRLGGDEFAILLADRSIDEAESLARTLICALSALTFSWDGKPYHVTASIGLAEIADGTIAVSELMSRADVACYTAKSTGRNRVCTYRADESDAGRYHRDIQIASGIRAAIAADRFRLFAQRIEYLQDSTPGRRYYEILLRMQGENGELLYPGHFIPAAERYDLMSEIDRWVIRTTLRRYGPRLPVLGDFALAINLSANSLNDPNLWTFVGHELEVSGISPHRLHFEITETALINNMAAANDFVACARATGCGITLDDFGAGLSSFSYLRQFPVDELKIDGNFIKQITTSAVDRAIVESINELGHKFGAYTIAEFVEDEATIELLRGMGIDMAQGYAIARPVPLEQILGEAEAGSA